MSRKSVTIRVCSTDELEFNVGRSFIVEQDLRLAVFKTEQGVVAMENSCPHAGGSLDNGIIEGDEIRCVWHGWCFNLQSGHCVDYDNANLKLFPVEVIDQDVYIVLDS